MRRVPQFPPWFSLNRSARSKRMMSRWLPPSFIYSLVLSTSPSFQSRVFEREAVIFGSEVREDSWKFGKCLKCVHYWAEKSRTVFVAVIDLPPRVPLRDHGSGQSIVGRRCDLSCPVCVVIPEHVTSNASDSESSYRKCRSMTRWKH